MRNHELSLKFWFQQIIPGFRGFNTRMFSQPIGIGSKTQAAYIDTHPIIINILHLFGFTDVFVIGGVIGFQQTLTLGRNKAVNRAAPPDIKGWRIFFCFDTCQCFTRRHTNVVHGDAILGFKLLLHALTPLFLRRTKNIKFGISNDFFLSCTCT